MGHTKVSLMRNRYANNLNQRVIVDDNTTLLGCNIGENGASDSSVVPLFFKKQSGAIVRSSNIPSVIINELNVIKEAISSLIMNNKNTLQSLVISNKIYVAKDKETLLSDLKQIPYGNEFMFMDQLVPTSATYRKNVTDTDSKLTSFFNEVTGDYTKINLWSYPQIMYGEFNTQFHEDARENSDEAYKHEQQCIILYESLANHLGVVPDNAVIKLKNKDTVEEMKTPSKTDKRSRQGGKLKINNKIQKIQRFLFRDIEVNDVVALVCSQINADYINIPSSSNGCNLIHVKRIDNKGKYIEGNYYRGGIHGLVMNSTLAKRDGITDKDVLWIWSLEVEEEPSKFKIPEDEVIRFCDMFN
jgi:hypothetical protein